MQKRKVRIRENSFLARLAARRLGTVRVAVVLGHTIHLHAVSKEDFLRRKTWVCHELRHVVQYDELGTIGFLYRYLLESLRTGYHNNRFEIEARASEDERELLERFEIV
jgi:hypothetical protein